MSTLCVGQCPALTTFRLIWRARTTSHMVQQLPCANLQRGSLCVTGILRIYYIRLLFYTTYDITWAAQPCWLWTAVEAELAIVCASAPALKPYFGRILHASGLTAIGGSGSNNSGVGRRTPNFGGAKSPKKNMMSPGGSTSFSFGESIDASIADRSMSPTSKKARDFEMEQLANGKNGTDVSITALPPYSPASGPVSPVTPKRRSSRTTPSAISFGEPLTRYGFEADISGGNHANHHHHHHHHARKASSKLPDLERGDDWDDDNDSPDDETAYHPVSSHPTSPAMAPPTAAGATAPFGGIKVEQRVDVDFSGNEQWPLALNGGRLGPNGAPASALPVPLEPAGRGGYAPPYNGYGHGFGGFGGFGDAGRDRERETGGESGSDNENANGSEKRGAGGSRTGSDEVKLVEIGGGGRGAGGGSAADDAGGGAQAGVGRSASSSSGVATSHHARIVRKFFG